MLPKSILAAGAVAMATALSGCATGRIYVQVYTPPVYVQHQPYPYNYYWGPFVVPHNPHPHHTYFQGPPVPCQPRQPPW